MPLDKAKIFIEVSDQPVTSTVVRSGKQVPVAKVNDAAVADWVGRIIAEPKRSTAHVVQQSVAAGAVIPKGTVVDLVMAPVGDTPTYLFAGAHADLAQRMVYDIVDSRALENEAVVEVLTKRPDPEQLDDEERALVGQALQQLDIGIDDNDPQRSYASAYRTVRNALAFKTPQG